MMRFKRFDNWIQPFHTTVSSDARVDTNNLTVFCRHIVFMLVLCMHTAYALDARADANNGAAPLERLFSSPAERQRLDSMRQTQVLKLVATPAITVPENSETPETLPPPISMQGYVKRSDGVKGTVWINHQAVREGEEVNSVRIGNLQKNKINQSQSLTLQIPANGQKLRLKAGQTYTPRSNQILELREIAKNPILLQPDGVEAGLPIAP